MYVKEEIAVKKEKFKILRASIHIRKNLSR